MPTEGAYLLAGVGFNGRETPYISLQADHKFEDLLPLGKTITLKINTEERFCVGWRDMEAGKVYACPDSNTVESKYEQCSACQKRTGFNPAFYHADSISPQQEARNLQPHILYLAHFGTGDIKVGISYAARGNSRLLEQGARSALILETFPSALIARQYEAKIAAMPGFMETLQLRKKIAALDLPYDHARSASQLQQAREQIEQALSVRFQNSEVLSFDAAFFPGGVPSLIGAHDCSDQNTISGHVTGMLGSLLFCTQQDTLLFLPLKKYTGYRATLTYNEIKIPLPLRQASLF